MSMQMVYAQSFSKDELKKYSGLGNKSDEKTDDDGGIFMMGNIGFFDGGGQKKDNQVWPLSECYPYAKKPSHPKVTSSRALVNSVAAYKILIDRVDGVLKKAVSNSDW